MLRSAFLLSLLLVGACSPITGLGWRRVVGVIDPQVSLAPVLTLPERARVGQPFTITVTTLGSSSCTRADGMEVKVQDLTADVTPYDRKAPGTSSCTTDLRTFPRDATLRFDRAGEARVRVHGRAGNGTPRVVDATIPVHP